MRRKYLGRVLMIGWLLGLTLTALSQEMVAPSANNENPVPSTLYQALIEATSGDSSASADSQLPAPLMGETTYQAETSFTGFTAATPSAFSLKPIKTNMIRVTIGYVAQFGYLASPADEAPAAALLLIHEWWGLNDAVKAEADRLASLGYRVFAIDLFAGQSATDRRRATTLVRSVQKKEALERIGLWAQWLSRPVAPGDVPLKLGVAGWGWGANLALEYSLEDSPISALALFYGEVVLDQNRLANLKCPLLGIYALRDGWVTPQRIDQFKDALAQAHAGFSIVSYDVQAGFMLNPASIAEERAAGEARRSMDAFLARHLGGETPPAYWPRP